ncbi:MAG: hypothetical protein MJZ23_05255 [Paludibacteraceae bacterium]|nr:hypothetical protein [Paludibacteraceae bacterium]
MEEADLYNGDEILILARNARYSPSSSLKLAQKRADVFRDYVKGFVETYVEIKAYGLTEKGWIVEHPKTATDSMWNDLMDIQIIRGADSERRAGFATDLAISPEYLGLKLGKTRREQVTKMQDDLKPNFIINWDDVGFSFDKRGILKKVRFTKIAHDRQDMLKTEQVVMSYFSPYLENDHIEYLSPIAGNLFQDGKIMIFINAYKKDNVFYNYLDIEIGSYYNEESATASESSIFYYHPDHLGSTAVVTDVDGRITQNVVYIPFGEVFVEERNGNWTTPYLFNAKELDEETGLYYYGARFLDPTGVQWLSVDPLFEKYAGMSPYNYCNNSPVNLVDYDGKEADVTGEGAATYKVTLQSKCSGIKLKFEGNKLKYDRLKNSKGSYVDLSDNDNKIIGVLDDQDIKVHITALGRNKNTMKVNGELFTVFGGSFFGNVVSTVVDQVTNEEKIMVDAYQVVNPFVLLDMDDLSLSKHGTSALHEMMEAYYGATISKKKKISSPRAGLPGSVYKEAHKMAPQQPSVRMSYIDSNNKESLSPTDESAFEQFQVYRKNMSGYEWKTIIKLPYVKNNNE